jgi:hypothetical protein
MGFNLLIAKDRLATDKKNGKPMDKQSNLQV